MALKLGEKKATTVRDVLNLTLISLVKFSLHSYKFSRPPTYIVADLLAIPPQWHQAFNFVFECRNIQALPLNVRSWVISSVASLVAPGGTLLLITRVRDTEAEPDGPPWPLSDSELKQVENLGLQQVEKLLFLESELDVKQVRIEYQRHNSLTGS